MTPLSKWKLSDKEEERIKKLLVDQLTIIKDRMEMQEFLSIVLTDTEFLMVAKRMVAVLLLDMGKTDVEIAKLLHVTRSTANRFRMVYKYGREKPEVIRIVKELKDNKEMEIFLKRLKEYLLTAPFGRIPKRSIF